MKASAISVLLVLAVLCSTAIAQSPNFEVRVNEEYLVSGAQAQEQAWQRARAAARRKAYRDAAARLQGLVEIRSVPLRPGQIEAFLPVVVPVDESTVANRVEARVRLQPREIAVRFNELRRDFSAASGLVNISAQTEDLHRQLAEDGRTPEEYSRLLTRIRVNHLVAHIYAALAKTQESPASARVPSEKGRQRAWQLAEIAVVMGHDSADAHLVMGDVLLNSDLRDAAESAYRRSIQLNGSSSWAHIKLAEAVRQADREPEAIAELREALRIDSKSAMAHTDLGFIFGSQQESARAIAEYREAIRLDPDLIDARNNLGIALARAGQIPEAVEHFREILRVDPDSALGYRNMGLALADMEKDDLAAEAFRHIVRINPNHFNARYDLGELFRLEGKYDDAVRQFREYLRLAPDTPQNQRNIRRARDFVQTHENP